MTPQQAALQAGLISSAWKRASSPSWPSRRISPPSPMPLTRPSRLRSALIRVTRRPVRKQRWRTAAMTSPKAEPILGAWLAKRCTTSSKTSSLATSAPCAMRIEVAASPGGKTSVLTLIPIPTMTKSLPASTSIPATFFPEINTSLGHLISARGTDFSKASVTAKPVARESLGHVAIGSVGRKSTENASDSPLGENQSAPLLPRPAVCSSATKTKPSGMPCSASVRSSSLVDETRSRQSKRKGSGMRAAICWKLLIALTPARRRGGARGVFRRVLSGRMYGCRWRWMRPLRRFG